ncbi:hypothetical protein PspLS_09453 [Pyricularia sp. CBS 133598]|nr:hypothetical protein PspLS_09453 [Pyricularia sp. CBS 133598]
MPEATNIAYSRTKYTHRIVEIRLFPGASPPHAKPRIYQVSACTILCLAYPSLTTLPQLPDGPMLPLSSIPAERETVTNATLAPRQAHLCFFANDSVGMEHDNQSDPGPAVVPDPDGRDEVRHPPSRITNLRSIPLPLRCLCRRRYGLMSFRRSAGLHWQHAHAVTWAVCCIHRKAPYAYREANPPPRELKVIHSVRQL